MKPNSSHVKNGIELFVYGILLITAIVPALFAVKNIRLSPDAMMYALVSEEILSGNGLRLPIIYSLSDNSVFVNGAVPFILEPPLFPIFLAIFGGVTWQNFSAAQTLNVISHVAMSCFTFLLIKKLHDNKGIALLTGILVSLTLPLLWNTHYLLAESFFIALITATMYLLILTRSSDKHNGILLIASACVSAAILTKLTGIALLPVLYWCTFTLMRNKSARLNLTTTLVSTILPIVIAGSLYIRFYALSGSIHGWNPPPPERTLFDAFTGTIKMIFVQFNLGKHPSSLIIIFALFFILFISINSDARRALSKHFSSGLDLILIFKIIYILLVSYAMATSQTVFESRYMSPLVPFLFIFCVLVIVAVWEAVRIKGFSRLSLCGVNLSLCILAFGSIYKSYVNSAVLFSRQTGHYRILNSPTYRWIKEHYSEDVIITSNRPYHLSFFGGYSTIRLPHRRFNINYQIPDNMDSFLPNRMSFFGSQILVLFEEAEEQYEGIYVAGLYRKREDNDNFVLIRSFSDGVVYRLKE